MDMFGRDLIIVVDMFNDVGIFFEKCGGGRGEGKK
jgi:hypothetical protein